MNTFELYILIISIFIFIPSLCSLLFILSMGKKMNWENFDMIRIALTYIVVILSGSVILVYILKMWGV